MQKGQPHFTPDQRRELVEEHPWMRRGGLPAVINVKVGTREKQKHRIPTFGLWGLSLSNKRSTCKDLTRF